MLTYKDLSPEQKLFVQKALEGENILVDACIGSGKTTTIQVLCNELPFTKRILYMTYNKLLKLDAKSKIKRRNVLVTNYHGFCYMELAKMGVYPGISDIIQEYNKRSPASGPFDLLVLDEYQDIEEEVAIMLRHLKECNPQMQIIAVGDMEQKIYDKTRLNAAAFVNEYLGEHSRMEFTQCFRLNRKLAATLGGVWRKKIVGVNPDCEVQTMDFEEIFNYLCKCDPSQVLCLGSNSGKRNEMLNRLESDCSEKYNKRTVWAKISEKDGGATQPTPDAAIFTTYDGCKGMERDICVLFDWTENYWMSRMMKPDARYEIVRNIFCVAASRAKRKLIIASSRNSLSAETLKEDEKWDIPYQDMDISGMFDFKYIEDVEAAYKELKIREISPIGSPIDVPIKDAMIDLSPCVGIFQEADYFASYDINKAIEFFFRMNKEREYLKIPGFKEWPVEKKVLYLVSLETGQNRYWHQVILPIVAPDKQCEIEGRLATRLPRDATVQVPCSLPFFKDNAEVFKAEGFADAVKDDVVYELKFVSELSHTHFLQCAMYMVSLGLEKGILWNVRTNQAYEVSVPNKTAFLNAVVKAVTKGNITSYSGAKKSTSKRAAPSKETERGKVKTFCNRWYSQCVGVRNTAEALEADGVRITPRRLAALAESRKLKLPVPEKVFAKYFFGIVTELEMEKKAKRKTRASL